MKTVSFRKRTLFCRSRAAELGRGSLWYILFLALIMSCASNQTVEIPPPKKLLKLRPVETRLAKLWRVEPTPEMVELVEMTLDSVISKVKRNSPEIKKYYFIDENKNIIVMAKLAEARSDKNVTAHYEVFYGIGQSETDGTGGLLIPFTVESAETGIIQRDKLYWKPQQDKAGILLSFDDAFFKTWKQNFDLFDRYNAQVTFFVKGEYNIFCNEALERGHDVGYHSINHMNLPKVSRQVFYRETLSGAVNFRNKGIPLNTFAYPFGLSNAWMHDELLKSYKILRGYGVTYRLYDSTQIREGYIISKAIDNTLFKKEEDFKSAVDIMLRTAKFIGGDTVLPLTTHDISDNADWGIKPQRLEYFLQATNDLHLKFYLYKDFID